VLLLTKIRQERGLSQAKGAAKGRIHPADWSKFESGRSKPYPKQLRRICRVLKWPVERGCELLQEIDADEKAA